MSASQRFTGKNLKIYWVDGTGTADVSGDRRTLDADLGTDSVDGAAGNDTAHYAVATLKGYGASMQVLAIGTAGTALAYRMREGQAGSLVWGELGTAAGQPKWGMPVLVKAAPQSYPFDNLVEISFTFEGQGDLAYDGRTAVWP